MLRLLNIETKDFREIYDIDTAPIYAVLSHRWIHAQKDGRNRPLDLSHAEFLAGTGDERGVAKIDKACEAVRDLAQQLELDLQWIWIDSCCIDKNNNEEHTEAINSMYEWYARSYVCIAYLDDADPFEEGNPSEWFRRGWCLQELIAPERILFYNRDWIGCGSRNSYTPGDFGQHSFRDRRQEIAGITRIDTALLGLTNRKDIKRRLDSIPACQKMSWASDRKTTKDEDMAYCLIGIFNIPHMYLKRGEGKRAFIRLQEEIIKQSNDLTLFAWTLSEDNTNTCIDDNCLYLEDLKRDVPENLPFFDSGPNYDLHGIFACGPSHFRHASRLEPTQLAVYNDEITVTSRGVKLKTPLLGSGPFVPFRMPLYCTDGESDDLLSIEVRLLGGSIYARTNCTRLPRLRKGAKVIPNQDDVFLAHNIHRFQECGAQMHKHAIQLPDTIAGTLKRVNVSPGYLWSSKHSLMITNGCRFFVGCANYESKSPRVAITLLFGLDHLQRPWFCLSNAHKSFRPHTFESRKSYLERVWRSASQHSKTAFIDVDKGFEIDYSGLESPNRLTGSIRAVRQRYHDQDVFKVDLMGTVNTHNASKIPNSPVAHDTYNMEPIGLTIMRTPGDSGNGIFGRSGGADARKTGPTSGTSSNPRASHSEETPRIKHASFYRRSSATARRQSPPPIAEKESACKSLGNVEKPKSELDSLPSVRESRPRRRRAVEEDQEATRRESRVPVSEFSAIAEADDETREVSLLDPDSPPKHWICDKCSDDRAKGSREPLCDRCSRFWSSYVTTQARRGKTEYTRESYTKLPLLAGLIETDAGDGS